MRKKLGKVLKKRGAKQEDISRLLDHYDHHSTAGDAAHTHSQSSGGSTKDALKTALQDHHGLSDEQVGQVMSQLGKLIGGMAGNGKPKASGEADEPKKDADQGPQDQKKEDGAMGKVHDRLEALEQKVKGTGARGSVSVYQGHSEDNKELLEHIQAEQQKHQLTTAEVESVLKRLRKEGAATKQDISDAFESWKPLSLPDGYEGVLKQARIDQQGKKVRDEARRDIRSAKNRAAAKRAKMSPKQRAKADAKKKKNDERFKLKYERVQDPLRQVNPKDVKARPSVVRALSGQSTVRETQREYIKLAEHATKEAEKAGMSHKELAGVLKQFKGKKETTEQQITAAIRSAKG